MPQLPQRGSPLYRGGMTNASPTATLSPAYLAPLVPSAAFVERHSAKRRYRSVEVALLDVNAAIADLEVTAENTAPGEVTLSVSPDSGDLVGACERAYSALGALLYPGHKRPGQWGWRAHGKRHARRAAANDRRVGEWQRRQGIGRPLNRAARRLLGIFAPIVGVPS